MSPSTVIKRIAKTTYEIQDDKDTCVYRTVQRNHLFDNYSKEKSLETMIEEFVTSDQRHDDFARMILGTKQRTGKMNDTAETKAEDSISFPIEPIHTVPTATSQKLVSTTSSDSAVGSSHFFAPT